MKLHNAMWPGLVGKEPGTDHPPISLERMLELTAAAEVNGRKFDGVDLFLFHPHTDPDASDDAIKAMADKIAAHGLKVGSLVAPVWPGTVGGIAPWAPPRTARNSCSPWKKPAASPASSTSTASASTASSASTPPAASPTGRRIPRATPRRSPRPSARPARSPQQHGERLAAEGEICWGGMHSWKAMLDTLEATGMPETVGFQADLAHTYLYLMGYNAPEAALLKEGYTEDEFWAAYKTMTDALRPWTFDFHVAQNDGSVHGTGSHDKTGRHCQADDPNGKLDIAKCSTYWLKDAAARGMKHICWDGCMFPNDDPRNAETWNTSSRR